MASRSLTLSPSPVWWSGIRRSLPYLLVYGLILALGIYGTANSERFLTERNVLNILRQSVIIGTVAMGQTVVILSGGIDLSVGSLVKLSVLVSAILMNGQPENIALTIVATLALGALVGALHALIITRLQVAPFIVTLGTYSILRGLALNISTAPIGKAAPSVVQFYDLRIGPVHALTLLFFVLLIVLMVVLRRTHFGRYVFAIGGNENVARLAGIPVNRVKYGVYILCSTLTALAGLFALTRSGLGDPNIGDGLELQSITAVVIGGTSLFGGRGSLIGTLGGVLLLGLVGNLLVVLNVNQWLRALVEGTVIVIAVALYKQQRR